MSPDADSVTVVITTHNRASTVVLAVDSVRSQSHSNIEIVLVDDGSEPPVGDLGSDVRVVRHDVARGVCAARNSGVEAGVGHYVVFLDDDDWLPPDAIEHSLRVIAESTLPDPVAALGSIAVVDDQGDLLEVRCPPTFPRGSAWLFDPRPPGTTLTVQNTLVVPREVVQEIGGWNENLRAWVHDDFFLRLARACSLQGTDHVTYRMLEPTGARQHVSRQLPARAAAMEQTLAAHEQAFRSHPRRHGKYLGTIAVTWLRCGEHRRARAAAWRSFRVDPRRPKAVVQLALALAGPATYARLSRRRHGTSRTPSQVR